MKNKLLHLERGNGFHSTTEIDRHVRRLKRLNVLAGVILVLLFTMMVLTVTGQTVVQKYGRLQKFGSHVCAEDGEQISLAGNSFFWSNWGGTYYNANTVDFLVDEMNTSIVRAAMGVGTHGNSVPGGYLQDPGGQKAIIEAVVNRAIDRGIYVIIDWHVEGDNDHWRNESMAFFAEMAQKYGHHPNVIYEIWNEPTHNNWHTSIRPYAVAVVNAIRQHDPDNLIIVGTETWSQRPDDASTNQIPDPNIAYTIHFYPDDPGNGQFHRHQLRANVTTAMNNGAAVFATEWGPSDAAPNPESDIWMQFLIDNKISHCMWSVNDKIADGDWQWSIFEPGTPGTGPYTMRGPGFYLRDLMHSWPWRGGDPIFCTAQAVPGRIEAESWCAMSGVQTEPTSDPTGGNENVGWVDNGDWIEYLITTNTAGSYAIDLRVAADGNETKTFDLSVNGGSSTPVSFTATGDWQNWTTISATIDLESGEQTLRLDATSDGFNINYFDLSSSCQNSGVLANIVISPGTVQLDPGGSQSFTATGYDECGDEVAFSPNWSANAPNGLFTASEIGSFQVSASSGGITGTAQVVVGAGQNLLTNGDFASGDDSWTTYINAAASASTVVHNQELVASISQGGSETWHVQVYQGDLTITNGKSYTLSFIASSAVNRSIEVNVEKNGDPWTGYFGSVVALSSSSQQYTYNFTMSDATDSNARVAFNLGAASGDVFIDDVVLIESESGSNVIPVANAGSNQNLPSGTTASSLDGSGSFDPDNGPSGLTYSWTQVAGASVTISSATAVNPSIQGLSNGNSYTFELVVYDGEDYSASSDVTVTVDNDVPPFSIRIEAEDFDFMGGIQTENCSEGGLNVGWTDAGDWMAYHDISIPSTGAYEVCYRVASQNNNGSFNLEGNAGATVFGNIDVSNSGSNGWQDWKTLCHTVNLSEGTQNFGLGVTAGGFNINWFEISSGSSARVREVASENKFAQLSIEAYPNPANDRLTFTGDLEGIHSVKIIGMGGQVLERSLVYENGLAKIDVSMLSPGMYMARLVGAGESFNIRFIKR